MGGDVDGLAAGSAADLGVFRLIRIDELRAERAESSEMRSSDAL